MNCHEFIAVNRVPGIQPLVGLYRKRSGNLITVSQIPQMRGMPTTVQEMNSRRVAFSEDGVSV